MSEWRQMVYVNRDQKPVEHYIEMMERYVEWRIKCRELQGELAGKMLVTITDHVTGASRIGGIEDAGITPFGWSRYKDVDYLVPTRSSKGDLVRNRLAKLGESPAVIQEMAEHFDVPPFYRDAQTVYYPGFSVLDEWSDQTPADQPTLRLFVVYNTWPEEGQPWDGGDYFELSSMAFYYGLKGY